MKYKIAVILVLVFSLLLGGCGLWMNGSYHHVTPHVQGHHSSGGDQVFVSSYSELRDAIEALVEDGIPKGLVYTSEIDPALIDDYMQDVIFYISTSNAIGAYALENITYEFGTNTGLPALAVEITYRHNRSEILRVKRVQTMEEAVDVITAALDNCNAGVTLCVDAYENMDITQMIQDYVENTPQKCMEMPQVAEMVYPDSGKQRVIELSFTYQNSRESLRDMQEMVGTVFASAELYVHGNAQSVEKYKQLYSFLMERYDYTVETSITPTYSLLRHGVGDTKAFATVYAAMCRQADLECQVVTGTKEGNPWYWNMVKVENAYYHLDLLTCSQSGGFVLKQDQHMKGYVWDYSAYPIDKSMDP